MAFAEAVLAVTSTSLQQVLTCRKVSTHQRRKVSTPITLCRQTYFCPNLRRYLAAMFAVQCGDVVQPAPGDTRDLNPVVKGAKYRATYKASVIGILAGTAPRVVSRGRKFYNKDRWTLRVLTRHMCEWAKNNPGCVPTHADVAVWVKKSNDLKVPFTDREIVIANTPEVLPLRLAQALVGGAFHEALHTKYSCKRDITVQEAVDLIIPRWAKVKDWSKYVKALLTWSNYIEDIRIERRGREQFDGIEIELHDLQDFILYQEEQGQMGLRSHGGKPGALSVLVGTFRDYGFGYDTDRQRGVIARYLRDNSQAVDLVLKGPLTPLLDEAVALTREDDTGCLRIAMDVIAVLAELSNRDQDDQENTEDDEPGDGKTICPVCGAPGSKLKVRPQANQHGGQVKGKGIVTCTECGWQDEIDVQTKKPKDPPPEKEPDEDDALYQPDIKGFDDDNFDPADKKPQKAPPKAEPQKKDADTEDETPVSDPQSVESPEESDGEEEQEGETGVAESDDDDEDEEDAGEGDGEAEDPDADPEEPDEGESSKPSKAKPEKPKDPEDENTETEDATENAGDESASDKTDEGTPDNSESSDSESADPESDGPKSEASESDGSSMDTPEAPDVEDAEEDADGVSGSEDGADDDTDTDSGTAGKAQDKAEEDDEDYEDDPDDANGDPTDDETDGDDDSEGEPDTDAPPAGGAGGYADQKPVEPDWSQLADDAMTQAEQDEDLGLQDAGSALEDAVNAQVEHEEQIQEGEAPWRPYDTSRDQAAVVKESARGMDTDKQNADLIVNSVKEEIAYLRARLRSMVRSIEMTGTSRGVPKGRALSSRYLTDTVAAIRAGKEPKRAFDRRGATIDMSMACGIVLDQSTSMAGLLVDATRILVALTEPLDALNCPTLAVGFRNGSGFNLGYSAFGMPVERDGGQYHRYHPVAYDIFKGFNERFSPVRWRFANTKAVGGTPMSDGIQFVLNALSYRKEAHRFLFVITDGLPDPGHLPVIRHQIRLAREAGIHIIGVGIGTDAVYVKTCFMDSVWASKVADIPKLLLEKLNELIDVQAYKRGCLVQDTSK